MYEQAAAENSFEKDEIFKIYLKMSFSFDQLKNVTEVYKNLPNYKARALIYQRVLLSDNIEKKLYLIFLLKDLFVKDKLLNIYSNELLDILKAIEPNEIPESYSELVNQNLDKNLSSLKIEFDNDIENCYRKKDEIVEVLSNLFKNAEKYLLSNLPGSLMYFFNKLCFVPYFFFSFALNCK